MSRVFKNKAVVSPSYDAKAHSSAHLGLGASYNNSSLPVPIIDGTTLSLIYFSYTDDAYKLVTVLTGTTYSITEPCQQVLTLESDTLTSTHTDYLTANPDALQDLYTSRKLHPTLPFTKADMIASGGGHYYPACDTQSLQYVQDVATPLGGELVINGTFNTDLSSWVSTNFSWSNGTALYDGSSANTLEQVVTTEVGKQYVIIYEVGDWASGSALNLLIDYATISGVTANGVYTYIFVAASTGSRIGFRAANTVFSIDNVSIKELTATEITNYTETCRTTLDNTQNGASKLLINQDATGRMLETTVDDYTMSTAESNGAEAKIGFKPNLDNYTMMEVVSGELQNFGSEEVTNGTFDTDLTGWTLSAGGGATWDNGVALLTFDTASIAYIQQNILVSGETYLVKFYVPTHASNSGNFQVRVGGINYVYDVADYEGKIFSKEYVSQGIDFRVYAINTGSIVAIDNVSVKELTTKGLQSATSIPSGVVES